MRERARSDKDCRRRCYGFLIRLGTAVVFFCILTQLVYGAAFVSGEAMFPRVRDGDFVVYYRLDKTYEIGDTVAFQREGNVVTGYSRVAARPGDTVDISEDGVLLVNGMPQTDEVVFATERLEGGITYPYRVPEGAFFLVSDHRNACVDSRVFGAIPADRIKGKVTMLIRSRGI